MAKKIDDKIIKGFLEKKSVPINVSDGPMGEVFTIHVSEDVTPSQIHSIVESIAYQVEQQDFAYTLIDILKAYYILDLFTDIPVPMKTEDGEEYPDYEACHTICTRLNLEEEIYEQVPLVGRYIEMLEQNVWRKLEYEKSLKPYSELSEALAEFYEILDDLNEIVENQDEESINDLLEKVNDVAKELEQVRNVKNIDDKKNIVEIGDK